MVHRLLSASGSSGSSREPINAMSELPRDCFTVEMQCSRETINAMYEPPKAVLLLSLIHI